MRFGPVPLAEAEGAILAHSVPLGDGQRMRKGKVLGPDDLARLAAAGLSEVVVARLDPGDVDEDSAASRLARAIAPAPVDAGLRLGPAARGRVNLIANGPGVLEVDAAAIDAINAVDEGITVATLPRWARVEEGRLAATIKIIPYAVPGAALAHAEARAAGALRVHGPRRRRVRLIVTGSAAAAGVPPAVEERILRLGAHLAGSDATPHAAAPLSEALSRGKADMVVILSDTATSDVHDVVPQAIRDAGGQVLRYGMPVDPGNLLVLGELGATPVLGLPGCAKSIALNGADWVLERLVCGVPVTADDIAAMGVGGLLKEVPVRPAPRRGAATSD